jgi:hypothetical protein
VNAHNIEQPAAASQLSSSDCLGDVLARHLRKELHVPSAIAPAIPPRSVENQFRRMWELGYRRLLPVIPPDAPIRSAGKRPGVVIDGRWVGRGRKDFNATEEDLDAWHAMGAGVGLLCDADAIGVDIDTLSQEWSARVLAVAAEVLGVLPRRIGLAPKTLLMARCEHGTRYRQIRFSDGSAPIERNGKIKPAVGLVELLAGDTCYFNVLALHPKTGKPYALPDGLPPYDQLPRVTRAQLDRFFERLAAELPTVASSSTSSVDRTTINQDGLKGDHDFLAEALAFLPNEPGAIGYDEWVRIAAACRGAFQDDYGLGLELFEEWSDKADIADPSETAARVYGSIEAPFGVGAGYIFDQARASGWIEGWQRTVASTWFDDAPKLSPEALFPEDEVGMPAASDPARFKPIPFDEAADTALSSGGRPLIKGLLDQGAMTVLYGESNVGKTFVAMDIAYHIARGRNWAGLRTTQLPVLYVAAEGGQGARRRAAALKNRYGPAGDDFHYLMHPVDLLRPNADLSQLLEMIGQLSKRPGLIVVDTLSRALAGGDENSSTDMGALVAHIDRLRKRTGAHILIVHHSGKDTSKGARGHSLLRAATDTEIEIRDGQIAVTKQRDLDGSWSSVFELDVVELGRDSDGDPVTSCVISLGIDDTGAEPAVTEAQLALISELVPDGTWRLSSTGRAKKSWIGIPVAEALGVDIHEKAGFARVREIVVSLLRTGRLVVREHHNHRTGRSEKFVQLAPKASEWFDASSAEFAGGNDGRASQTDNLSDSVWA